MAVTAYNDQRETYRSSYSPGFERLYAIRRYIHIFILALIPLVVFLPALWWLWLLVVFCFLAIDSDRTLRMQDPFGRGKGPYIKKNARSESGQIEEWSVISTPQHRGGDGIWPLGNNMYTREEVWASDDYVRTHAVVSGTTGSGKTVTMSSTFIYVAMVANSGVVMIDGKADPKTWFDLFAMAVAADRADDFLVLNFVVGATQEAEFTFMAAAEKELWEEFRAVESNTFNLFGTGTSDTLFEIGSALLGADATGDNKMWAERAEALLRSMLKGLTEKRDLGQLKISIATLQEYMSLERLSELENDPDISEPARHQVGAVLNEIAGYRDAMKVEDPQKRVALLADQPSKQFTFLHMQFGALFAMLVGTYGHIANVEYSDIWTPDVIRHRRIMLVMLPALEKAPTSLAQLGRMATSAIKSALSQSISGSLTGRKADLVDRRPTNSLRAMVLIYDEAASYIQAGTADVASQSRSLGAFNIFSSQEWGSFKAAGEIEAQRIISNTGLKIVLKNEDADTADQFMKAVGDAAVLKSGGKRHEKGNLVETERRLEMVPRVTFQQLMNQAEGQAYMKWRDTMLHIKMPFVQVKSVVRAQRNDLVPLPGSMAADRIKIRENKRNANHIAATSSGPLNLIDALVDLAHDGDESYRKELQLFEKLVRTTYAHQVVIPWEECPPPRGNVQHTTMLHTEADLLAVNLMWALKLSSNDPLLKPLIDLPLGTDTRFEIPFLPHEAGMPASVMKPADENHEVARALDLPGEAELADLLSQLNGNSAADTDACPSGEPSSMSAPGVPTAQDEAAEFQEDDLDDEYSDIDDEDLIDTSGHAEHTETETPPAHTDANSMLANGFSSFLRQEEDMYEGSELEELAEAPIAFEHAQGTAEPYASSGDISSTSNKPEDIPLNPFEGSDDPLSRAMAAAGVTVEPQPLIDSSADSESFNGGEDIEDEYEPDETEWDVATFQEGHDVANKKDAGERHSRVSEQVTRPANTLTHFQTQNSQTPLSPRKPFQAEEE